MKGEPERCSRCCRSRQKRERWFYIHADGRTVKALCPSCAPEDMVAQRRLEAFRRSRWAVRAAARRRDALGGDEMTAAHSEIARRIALRREQRTKAGRR